MLGEVGDRCGAGSVPVVARGRLMSERPNAKRAAEYVRMSTDHQQYSTKNQSDINREFATKRGLEVVRTFADAGKSGLRLEGRDALKELIDLVQSGNADFDTILVYDVSRWGRFQDADESAYYEYICKRAGISVHYCAEQFENDGSPVSVIVKGVKRAMAGEYSRGLSANVFKGQCTLIELGFRQGGIAGYGLRRQLRDASGAVKGLLKEGEHKSLQTDRVVLVPGPPEEVEVVRKIYRRFVDDRRTEREIADELNSEKVQSHGESGWTRGLVHEILTNEKYIGHNVYNRVSFKLKKKRIKNPPEMWIRHDEAFEAIVDRKDFLAARAIILDRHRRLSDDELLSQLKALASQHGRLSGLLIDESEAMPSSSLYAQRFGSLLRAYALIGYDTGRDYSYVEVNKRLRKMHPEIVEGAIREIASRGGSVVQSPESDLLAVNGIFTVSVVIARCQRTEAGSYRWHVRFDEGLLPDLTVVVRMDGVNEGVLDYYILPSLEFRSGALVMRSDNGALIDSFRFDNLDYFWSMAELVKVTEAA